MSRYHFIGICGKAMGTLAVMLQSQGHTVTGSDEGFYEPMLSYLKSHHIDFTEGHAADNIPESVDYIIIGKHAKLVPETNPEVAAAFEIHKEKIRSLPEVLSDLCKDKEAIVCAGSFGKSTITTLSSFVLEHAGKKPSYFIGAVPVDLPDSGLLQNSNIFVLEGDEYPSSNWDYRAKFMHYHPRNIILTSCEHDHINAYPTLESYLEPFGDLVKILPADGLLVYAKHGAHIEKQILPFAACRTVSYGIDSDADYFAANIKFGPKTTFDIMKSDNLSEHAQPEPIAHIETMLLGVHSIENIVGVAAMMLEKGLLTGGEFAAAIKDFHGVKGRLDIKKTASNVTIIESFGSSHPKAIADIRAVRLHFPAKRTIVVFEPHTFGWRNRANLKWYEHIFDQVHFVYIFQPPTHGAGTHDQLSQEEIVAEVKKNNPNVFPVQNKHDVYRLLREHLDEDSLVLLMTSGSLDGLPEELPKEIQSLKP